jgi:hypothetical protein
MDVGRNHYLTRGNAFFDFQGSAEKIHEILQLGKPFSGQLFEPRTYRLRSRTANYSFSKFGAGLMRPLYQTLITTYLIEKENKRQTQSLN